MYPAGDDLFHVEIKKTGAGPVWGGVMKGMYETNGRYPGSGMLANVAVIS